MECFLHQMNIFCTIKMWISLLRAILSADYFCIWRNLMGICLFWPLKGILWNTKPHKGFTLSSLVGFSGKLVLLCSLQLHEQVFPCLWKGWATTNWLYDDQSTKWVQFWQSMGWVHGIGLFWLCQHDWRMSSIGWRWDPLFPASHWKLVFFPGNLLRKCYAATFLFPPLF